MGLRMKNFNMGVYWKIQFLGGFMKYQYIEGNCLKRRAFRVLIIFVYKGLTSNLEVRNNFVWVLSNIWRLGRIRDTKFGRMFLMKSYWILQIAWITAFTISQLLKENQQGVKLPPTLIHIRVKMKFRFWKKKEKNFFIVAQIYLISFVYSHRNK